jgi:hypothetical protein
VGAVFLVLSRRVQGGIGARVGEPALCSKDEQLAKLSALLAVEGSQELVFDGGGRREGGVDSRLTFWRVLDDVPAAVDGVATAENQPLALEVVQQADQLRGIDANSVGERLLAHRALTQLSEHLEVAWHELAWLERVVETVLQGAAELHQEHP